MATLSALLKEKKYICEVRQQMKWACLPYWKSNIKKQTLKPKWVVSRNGERIFKSNKCFFNRHFYVMALIFIKTRKFQCNIIYNIIIIFNIIIYIVVVFYSFTVLIPDLSSYSTIHYLVCIKLRSNLNNEWNAYLYIY